MASVPKIIKNFNLIVDGKGYAGLVEEVKLPELKIKEEEHRAGGMDAPMPIDMGMEKMELGFTLSEHVREVFRQFGLQNQNAVGLTFRAAKADDVVVEPYVIEARGMYNGIMPGSVKPGEKTPFEATVSLTYLKIELRGETLIEIDVRNMKRIIGGKDQLAEIRKIISA